MRLSWVVLICQTIILVLTGISIAMEIIAFMSDLHWNSMVENTRPRFSEGEFLKCNLYCPNDTAILNDNVAFPNYERIFNGKKRDLPFELPFLGLMGFSFAMYATAMGAYFGWTKILPNIYISMACNTFGTIIHVTSFCLILTSTLMYSDRRLHYMPSPACYPFHCDHGCDTGPNGYVKGKPRHEAVRACLEKLHVCQRNGLKDRTVFLLLGCIIASTVALVSLGNRLRRYKNCEPHNHNQSIEQEAKLQPL